MTARAGHAFVKGEIKSLTGIRGVAACYVLLYHIFKNDLPSRAAMFLHHGYLAVDLFFVLSGFVMAITYTGAFIGGFAPKTYAHFIYKRLGRIYPLYFVTTIVAAIVTVPMNTGGYPSLPMTVQNLTLVNAWRYYGSINPVAWSISTEFACYLAFPLLVLAALRFSRAVSIVVLAVSVFILWYIATMSHPNVTNGPLDIAVGSDFYPLLRCVSEFVIGMLSFRLARSDFGKRLLGRGIVADLLTVVTLAGLCVANSDFGVMLVVALLIAALAHQRGIASKLLSTGIVYWLGLVSYSIYLVHGIMMGLRGPIQGSMEDHGIPHAYTLACALCLALTMAIAPLTYYGIERPAREWSRRLIHRRTEPIAAEPSAP